VKFVFNAFLENQDFQGLSLGIEAAQTLAFMHREPQLATQNPRLHQEASSL
jgi:hypothetical protein